MNKKTLYDGNELKIEMEIMENVRFKICKRKSRYC